MKSAISTYNTQLSNTVNIIGASHPGFQGMVFDTHPVFNTLLDNADTSVATPRLPTIAKVLCSLPPGLCRFGFINSTGFCDAYINGTATGTTEIPPCAAVSNYLCVLILHLFE